MVGACDGKLIVTGRDQPAATALAQIEANHAKFDRIESSWHRWTPWGFRRQYQLVKANEPLFAAIGVTHKPLDFEVNPGHTFGDWLVRKWLHHV
jgi:hypothetical protein